MEKNQLVQSSTSSLEMIQSTKTSDLVHAKPISVQIAQGHIDRVFQVILKAVSKCDLMLGTNSDSAFLEMMADELMDTYKYDSIEDLIEALKKGRRGFYGKNYNKFNLVVVSEWMAKHLEEKAIEREKLHENRKKEEYILPEVDYEAYKKRETKPKKKKEDGYEKFKSEYYRDKILKK